MIEHTTGELRSGMRVRLREATPFAKTHPVLTVIEVSQVTGRVKLRHDPPAGGKGFAYFFWHSATDLDMSEDAG